MDFNQVRSMFINVYRANIYDAIEMRSQNAKVSSSPDYTYISNEITSTRSEQDMKADSVKLQENPAYAATNKFS